MTKEDHCNIQRQYTCFLKPSRPIQPQSAPGTVLLKSREILDSPAEVCEFLVDSLQSHCWSGGICDPSKDFEMEGSKIE